jgi:ActR/RegA family two-component response regulator
MSVTRILFVDDEEGIRITLPAILQAQGFQVRVAATVAEALVEISSREFDVLISDLNIGNPGDGFTVVSAMRRTQPNCVSFILTGYPAFETALQALRSQVDDYLLKPTDVQKLVGLIRTKLSDRRPYSPSTLKRVSTVLRDSSPTITEEVLRRLSAIPAVAALPLSDSDLVDHVPEMIRQIAAQLDSSEPGKPTEKLIRSAYEHGQLRRKQKYSVPMLVDDTSLVDKVVYEVVQSHLLALDLSFLITDLKGFNQGLQAALKESIRAFLQPEAAAA